MTASSIYQRPAPFIAAAAAAVAIVAGSVALSASHHDSAPGQHAPTSVVPAPPAHHAGQTASGGHIMLGD